VSFGPDRPAVTSDAQQDRRLELEALERIGVWGDLDPAPFAVLEANRARPAASAGEHVAWRRVVAAATRVAIGLLAFWVFLLALALMKDGARGLAPAFGDAVSTVSNAVGIGWLGALLVLSGSPVAASSLALFAGGFLETEEAYGMLVGSRLGAAFVVLVVGALYAYTGRTSGRRAPISIGILALVMTALVYVPGGLLGLVILRSGALDSLTLTPPQLFFDLTEALTAPVIQLVETLVSPDTVGGAALVFGGGVGLLLVSFRLVDELLPSLDSAESSDARSRWYVGPWTMFGIGLVVALATLSVSVALGLLVPAVSRGYVRRDQILPYIAGANITTLVDTLVVAILLGNDTAPRIVLAVALGITIVTLALLAFGYRPARRLVFSIQEAALASPRRFVFFVAVLFACPLALVLIR
jgi:Na+/phosphate symporter